jgi:methyltransferase (TIGR00027 family)
MTDNNPPTQQTSGTAMATAFMRALGAHDPRPALRGQDTLAEIFLDEDKLKPIQNAAIRAWVMKEKLTPGAYEFMLARTAFFDKVFEEALKTNIPQVILLGAGYDSRAYRYADFIWNTQIFELDAAPTQERKLRCLQGAGISIPPPVHFVPIDFTCDDLKARLTQSGFSPEKHTVYIWEGVTYYLSAEVVDDMLAFVKVNSPAGSAIAFDYAAISEAASKEDSTTKLRQMMQERHAGEPVKFGIRLGEIEAFIAQRGFAIKDHLTAAEMQSRYLAGSDDLDIAQIPSVFRLVEAKVK